MIIDFPNGDGGNQEPPPCKDYRSAYFDLEPLISDILHMSKIVVHLTGNANLNGKDATLAFAVFHLQDMLEEFKEQYYAGVEECRDGAA